MEGVRHAAAECTGPRSCWNGIESGFWGWTAAAALLLIAGQAPLAQATPEYEFTLIEAFDVDYDLREVILRDINEAGLVVGTAAHDGFYDGFVWDQVGDKNIIPLLWPAGMNNLNQIVEDGKIYDSDTGTTTNVPPAGGYPVPRLMAINDVGTAVGFSECSCSNSDRTRLETGECNGSHPRSSLPEFTS